MNLMMAAVPYTGSYFSKEWVWKNILRMTEDDIEEIKKQIKEEARENEPTDPETGEPLPPANGGVMPPVPMGMAPPGAPPMAMGQQQGGAQQEQEYNPDDVAVEQEGKRKNRFNLPLERA